MGILLKGRRLAAASNLLLIVITLTVAAVCFIPQPAATVSAPAPYTCGNRQSNKVSLMFNVYEGAEQVGEILDILRNRGLKATFFMGGCFADDHVDLLVRVAAEGHELANHGYFHIAQDKADEERNREEIESTDKLIRAATGVKPVLFAPPSGAYGSATLNAARQLGYFVVLWSKDTIDWKYSDPDKVYTRATDGIKGGDLVLMHPKQHTVQALPRILDRLAALGLVQTTVSENIFGE